MSPILNLRNLFRAAFLAVTATPLLFGCGAEPSADSGAATRANQALTAPTISADAVFGFESAGAWSTTAGATLAQSSTHSQGSSSLSVKPSNSNGYVPIVSIALGTLTNVSTTLAVDIMLPTAQPNPHWYGTFQIYLNSPSRSINSQFLTQVELTGKPLNAWNTLKFPIGNTLVTSLLKSGTTDLTVTLVLNVQVPTTGTYLIDNLRFIPVAASGCNGLPNGTACTDNNACTSGEACQSNNCKPASTVTCTALDQCHSAGTCNASTGVCSNPNKANNTSCDDGNVCTSKDACQNGVCQGSGTCGPVFTVSPSTIDFGSLILTGVSSTPITVTNTGTAAGSPVLNVAGTNASEFAVIPMPGDANACTATTSLSPGANCHAYAQFIPLTPGNKSAVITVNNTTGVTMTGVVPPGAVFSASPSTVDFGSLILTGVESVPVTLTNTGPVAGVPVIRVEGTNADEFAATNFPVADGGCDPGIQVAPGAGCKIWAQFVPLTPGNKSGVIKVANAKVVTMTGVVPPGAVFSASPSTVDFGSLILTGVESVPVTLTNTGPVAGTPIIRVEGINADEFAATNFPVADGGCDTSTPVAPGASCKIWAQFVPLTPGNKSGVIKVANAKVVTMTGVVPPGAVFSATPSTVDFGSLILTGVESVPVTLTNTGPVAGVPVIRVEGTNADEFAATNFPVADGGCDTSSPVAPGASCKIWAQFVPLTPGYKSGVIKVANAKVVTMTGIVPDGAVFSASPNTIDFGSLIVSARMSVPVTLTNTGPIAGIPVIRVEGTNADEFTFTNFPVEDGGCDTSTPVAPGANCMIWAQFVPLRSGSKSAVLKVANAKVITMTGSSP